MKIKFIIFMLLTISNIQGNEQTYQKIKDIGVGIISGLTTSFMVSCSNQIKSEYSNSINFGTGIVSACALFRSINGPNNTNSLHITSCLITMAVILRTSLWDKPFKKFDINRRANR